jgi:hypothetical protein
LKRNAPKVKVGVVKRKKNSKAQVPVELLEQRPDLEKRLNARWAAARPSAASGTGIVKVQVDSQLRKLHACQYAVEQVEWPGLMLHAVLDVQGLTAVDSQPLWVKVACVP